MAKIPNATARPNDYGGTDVNVLGGKTVRIAFNDGQTEVYVFDYRMVHQYEAKFSYLTPLSLLNTVISDTLLAALGVRGAQREDLMAKIEQRRDDVRATWMEREKNYF